MVDRWQRVTSGHLPVVVIYDPTSCAPVVCVILDQEQGPPAEFWREGVRQALVEGRQNNGPDRS